MVDNARLESVEDANKAMYNKVRLSISFFKTDNDVNEKE